MVIGEEREGLFRAEQTVETEVRNSYQELIVTVFRRRTSKGTNITDAEREALIWDNYPWMNENRTLELPGTMGMGVEDAYSIDDYQQCWHSARENPCSNHNSSEDSAALQSGKPRRPT